MDPREVVSIVHAVVCWLGFLIFAVVYAFIEQDFEPVIIGFVLLPVFLIFRRR